MIKARKEDEPSHSSIEEHSLLLPCNTEEPDSSGVQAFHWDHWCCLARQKNSTRQGTRESLHEEASKEANSQEEDPQPSITEKTSTAREMEQLSGENRRLVGCDVALQSANDRQQGRRAAAWATHVYLPADPQPADPPREALQFADDHQQLQMEAMAKALMANTAAISELKDVAHSWGGGTRMEGDVRRGERGQGSWASGAWTWLGGEPGWWVGGARAKSENSNVQ